MKRRLYFYESYSTSLTVWLLDCMSHLLYYTVEYELRLRSTDPSWCWDHVWPIAVILGQHKQSPFKHGACIQWEVWNCGYGLLFVFYHFNDVNCSNALHISCNAEYQVHLISTSPSWSWDHEGRVTSCPRARSDLSPMILGRGGNTPFWYDVYIQ